MSATSGRFPGAGGNGRSSLEPAGRRIVYLRGQETCWTQTKRRTSVTASGPIAASELWYNSPVVD
jgi:hypothetical protein